jgi:tRNA A37 methylthiotransferase MiaB
MNGNTLAVGLVHIYSGLNLQGQRPNEEKLQIPEGARQYGSTGSESLNWEGIPYPVGLLQAYVQRYTSDPSRYRFGVPLHRRVPVEEAVAHLDGSDVAAFSTYVWNIRMSLEIARRLKERRPETLTVFGGPQVPDRAEEFLRAHPYVDVAVHGEGEAAFLRLLERAEGREWADVPSISYLDGDGRFVHQPRAPRIERLDDIPSPYLSGVFDALMAANPNSIWYAVMETNRGCPFACTFCDWGSAVNTRVRQFDLDRVRREIDWMAAHNVEYVFCCDANFGMFPRDVDIAQYVGRTKRATGYPIVFATQATKNATERSYAVQSQMAADGVQGAVTISYQSMDPHTLSLVRRQNISLASFSDLQARYVAAGVPTYTDMILGLPGETYDSYARGLEGVIAAGQHERVAFYDCALLPNAEMASAASRREHGLLTVQQRIIAAHSDVAAVEAEEVPELLEIVIATASMPAGDWRRARQYGWWLELLYFDRIFQVPLAVAGAAWHVPIRACIEAVMDADAELYPLLAAIGQRFADKALRVQHGEPPWTPGGTSPAVWWPVDQLELIRLVESWQLDPLYEELQTLLGRLVISRTDTYDAAVWSAAVDLNRRLFRRPFVMLDMEWEAAYDVWRFYLDVLSGREPVLRPGPVRYRVRRTQPSFRSLRDWCEYLILCQNHKPGYLYPLIAQDTSTQAA